jgi:hypothetical protein
MLIGLTDYGSGIDVDSLRVTAELAGVNHSPPVALSEGVYEVKLAKRLESCKDGKLTVAVKDKQGNETKIVRTFSVEEVGGQE